MLTATDIQGKNVLLRADLDVPVKDSRVENRFRLQALLPTLKLCLENARRTCLIGHLGRPESNNPAFSLAPVLEELKRLLNQDIFFVTSGFSPGECWTGESPLALIENLRFDPREERLDRGFAEVLSQDAEIYVYEAFANYRPSTSLQTIPELLPTRTGIQFDKEIATLNQVLQNPAHPTLLIASGAKMDKLEILKGVMPKFDRTLLGGKFASPDHLTSDGLDLNQETTSLFLQVISQAQTIVLNGPLGYYEDGIHATATKAIFQALKDSSALTILGGGDTIAAIPTLGFKYSDFGFVSTGGGAMLDFLAIGTHPLLEILARKA
ncbi:MAG: Phosphoglycerate kinase [Candidatus Collierbacteria bacterium GW2011_GWB1_45_35]|uniref:Phosphoglycerate kinase n=2 Tax=Candidatus Collieribacteriota TaxID=1752725 RepID=A0A0G1KNM1_9BACT|nr:MAG: Phosphoglycerate kinase [Microgenomates group bacterium GW2011_GWC1_44_23]KKT85075.1 MAG: Phosphoglycerate kinase [Candidatus Collierbacteria bacterium GW2011_GWA2_44_99]KKT96028.1 MAG: Phosphoglycerate kinase [Candidatus Collierbacteria bacterium GW2011_GWA1_45_15]KKU01098.1 MAG: Phosphoglycerate kinase [Candidatus Collierbacteria bacterium GW2011_GWB2_45_17]KKU05710.1 MAG: Phosphoglycerate kinase [Candidatus Collierbacteria bacterium GW2011_GWB1_45_35]KKU08090.1 MAG: Phosphoglycerate